MPATARARRVWADASETREVLGWADMSLSLGSAVNWLAGNRPPIRLRRPFRNATPPFTARRQAVASA